MTSINLSIHFFGPTWAWWIIATAAMLVALGSLLAVGLTIWEWDAKRRAINNIVAKHMAKRSGGVSP